MANQGSTPKVSDLAFGCSLLHSNQVQIAPHFGIGVMMVQPPIGSMYWLAFLCSVPSWDGDVCEWEDPRVFILGATVETKSWAIKCDKDSFVAYKLHHVQCPPFEWKWKLFSMMPHPYCQSSFIIHRVAMCLSLCGVITHMHAKNAQPHGWGFPHVHSSKSHIPYVLESLEINHAYYNPCIENESK